MTGPPEPVKPAGAQRWPRRLLQIVPWLAMAVMAAAWPRRRAAVRREALPPTPERLERAEPGRGRAADAPWRIPPVGWKDIVWRTWRNVGRDGLPSVAGGVTFYLLLASFPAVAAFVSVYGLFLDVGTVEKLLFRLSAILPDAALDLLGQQMMRLAGQRHEVLSAAFAAGTLFSIWTANAGVKALLVGLNVAYNEREKRSYFRRTLFTYAGTVSMLLLLSAITVLTVAAPMVLQALDLARLQALMAPLRWLLVWLITAGAFTLIYRHGPSRRPPQWRWVAFGGAAAALVWIPGSLGFTFYLDNFSHLGATYGSLGAVVGFMLWVWFSVMVVLIGAEFSAEIEHQTACDTTEGPAAPLGERGAFVADTVGAAFTVSPHEAADMAEGFARRQLALVARWLGR